MKNSFLLGCFFLLSVGSVLTFNGCMQTESSSQLTIQLPPLSKELVGEVGTLSTDSPWSGHLSTASNINCYAVMIGGPEADMSHSYCDQTDGTRLMNFGYYAGGVPSGGTLSIDVPPGLERNIYLVAMQANAGYCHDFHGSGPSNGQITHPRLIETVATSLDPGEQRNIQIHIPADLSSLPEVDKCQVNDFPTNTTNPVVNLFGNGRDGNFTSQASHTVNFSTDNYVSSASLSHSPASGSTVGGSKKFSASRFVTAVDTATGRNLTLDSGFTTDEFSAEDEVIWAVVSRAPLSNPCGGNLNAGSWGTGTIAGVAGNVITLSDPITSDPSSLSLTNIAASTLEYNSPHCRIQVSRMPNFENFHVTSSNDITVQATTLDSINRTGGVVAFRAKHLILDDSLTINVSERGYHGVSGGTGSSPFGNGKTGTTLGSHESGGGVNGGEGGGGGGHLKAGGSSTGSAVGGVAMYVLCSGSDPCLPVRDKIILFGGAGGAANTSPGSRGGGVVVIHAERISGSGTLTIQASGADGLSGTGGGAGGTIHLTGADIDAGLLLDAKGGGNGGGNGGVGSGGAVEVSFCDSQSDTDPNTNINISTGVHIGVKEVRDESSLCL